MFKRGAGVTGFQIGHFIQTADGAAKTTGTPACKRLLDGTPGTLTNAASYDSTAGVWKIDLAAGDTNGDMVGLSFTLADCLPIGYTLRTATKLVSELNDYAGGDTSGTTTLLSRVVGTLATGTHNPQSGDAYARLTGAVEPAIADVPTNAELAVALGTADDATLAAIAALNNLSSAQAQSAAAAALAAYDPPTYTELEARTLLAANYFDPATDTVAFVSMVGLVEGSVASVAGNVEGSVTGSVDGNVRGSIEGNVDGKVLGGGAGVFVADGVFMSALNDMPTVAEFEARTLLSADYVIVSDLPSVPSTTDIKTKLEEDGSKLDHLWEMTENDGGTRRLTMNALELAPTGTGSGLTPQETADAVNNLAPTGASGAAGSIRAQLVDAAKTGADDDTLKTLSDQIDALLAGGVDPSVLIAALEQYGVAKPGDPMTIARRP